MITVIKKIIIKEKEGKKQGEKKRVYDETRSWDPGARFSKVPIINGPGKRSPFALKIEISIVLHLTR